MFNILNKNSFATPQEAEWFATYARHVLYEKINARKEYISVIKAFYNSSIKSTILRITLDIKYHLDIQNQPLYIMLDYNAREMSRSGHNFESSISDKDRSIQWIHNNELLTFYPDNNIMSVLSKKL